MRFIGLTRQRFGRLIADEKAHSDHFKTIAAGSAPAAVAF